MNAQKFLETQKEFGSFNNYLWKWVDGKPKKNNWKAMDQIPASTKESDVLTKDLKSRGFRFLGSTICYAFMQGAGLVNDHITSCFRHKEVQKVT